MRLSHWNPIDLFGTSTLKLVGLPNVIGYTSQRPKISIFDASVLKILVSLEYYWTRENYKAFSKSNRYL